MVGLEHRRLYHARMADTYQSPSEAAQRRILEDEDPILTAHIEQVAVLHSIRRIILWAAFGVPALIVVGYVVLIAALS